MAFFSVFRSKGIDSTTRRGLRVGIYEGLSSVVLANLLAGPFLTAYLLHIGANTQQIGIVLALPALMNMLQIVGAIFMQRITSRRRAYVISGIINRIVGISTGLIPFLLPKDMWVITYIVCYAMWSITSSLLGIVWTSLISDMVPKQVRGSYFGIRNIWSALIGSGFVFALGYIMDRYEGELGFNILYLLGAATVVLNVWLFFRYPDPPFEKSTERRVGRMVMKPLQDKLFIRAILFLAFWVMLTSLAHPFFSYVMLDVMKISYTWVSVFFIVERVFSMGGFLVWGKLTNRFSTRRLLLWTLPLIAMTCVLWGAIAIIPAIPVLLLIFALNGFGSGGFGQMVFIFIIGEDTPKADRPMFIGIYAGITGIAGFFGPIIGGYVFEALKNSEQWIVQYGFFTAVGVVLLLYAMFLGPLAFQTKKHRKEQLAALIGKSQ